MSANVDKRIVEMQFDNAQFESGIRTSIKSLGNLEKSLDLKEAATKGFEAVAAASKGLDFNSISTALDTVSYRFSTFGIIGTTVLQNIANTAFSTGKKIVDSFTIDPIKSGFSEYETQINAIQTILANTSNKGTTLDQVNEALDELNTYADKTIYNFTEMTKNIGTFTAAGVELDTAVAAIKGIANLGAVSGSTSQQVSTAMYQLSQALATGRVSLMDWNSVVNAGMGGQVFQEALKETARVHGIAIDEMIEKNGSFRESLTTEGWLTSDILTETLAKFTGDLTAEQLKAIGYTDEQIQKIIELGNTANDAATKVKTFTQLFSTIGEAIQSGWTNSWEIVIGDFEEAKSFLTDINDLIGEVINSSSDKRNDFLRETFQNFVRPSDWANLETAGYKLDEFQQKLTDVAKTHGVDVAEMISNGETFESSLESGWLTIDIFNEALNSMETTSSEAAQGTISNLQQLQDMVNQVIRGDWGNGLARKTALTDAGFDYSEIQNAVNKVMNGLTLTEDDLTSSMKESAQAASEQSKSISELKNAAEDANTPIGQLVSQLEKPSGRDLLIETVLSALRNVINIAGTVKSAFNDAFSFTPNQLYDIIKGLHDFVLGLEMSDSTAGKLRTTLTAVFSVISVFTNVVSTLAEAGFKVLSAVLKGINVDFLGFSSSLGTVVINFSKWINSILDGITSSSGFITILNAITFAFSRVSDVINIVLDVFKNLFNLAKSEIEFLWADKLATKFSTLKSNVTTFSDTMGVLFDIVKEGFIIPGIDIAKNAFMGLLSAIGLTKDGLLNFYQEAKQKFIIPGIDKVSEVLSDLFSTINDAGAKAVPILSEIGDKIKSGFGAGTAFDAVKNAIGTVIDKAIELGTTVKEHLAPIWNDLKEIWSGVSFTDIGTFGVMTYIAKLISTLATQPLSIVSAASDVLGALENTLNSFTKNINAKTLVSIALAVGILSISLIAISNLVDASNLNTGLMGISVLLLGVVAALKLLNQFKLDPVGINAAALSMILVSAALSILAGALIKLTQIGDFGQLSVAITGLGTSLLGLMAAIKVMGTSMKGISGKDIIASAVSLVIFTLAVKQLASAMLLLKDLSWEEITKGLVTIGGLLAGLGVFFKLFQGADLNAGAKSLKDMGIALVAIAGAIKILGDMDPTKLSQGFEAIAATMVVLAASMFIAGSATGTVAASSLLAMAAALNLLIIPIAILGKMNFNTLVQGMIAVTLLLAGLTAAMAVMGTLGAASAGAGIGILAIAVALNLLVAPIAALGSMEWTTVAQGLTAIAAALLIFAVAGLALTPASAGLIAAALAMAAFGAAILLVGVGLAAITTALVTFVAIGVAGATTIVAMLTVIAMGIASLIPQAVASFLSGLAAVFPTIAQALITIILQLFEVIKAVAPALMDTIGYLINAAITAIITWVPTIFNTIATAVMDSGVLQAIASKFGELVDKGKEILTKVVDGIKSVISDIIQAGKDVISGFIEGLQAKIGELWEAAKGIGQSFLDSVKGALDEHSPSKEMDKIGVFAIMGLTQAVRRMGKTVWDAGYETGSTVLDSVSEALSGTSDLLTDSLDITPVIRPTMDLSEIQNGVNSTNSMLGKVRGLNLAGYMNGRFVETPKRTTTSEPKTTSQNFTFTQNNYSPKSLSRVDIYRQTRNQFSMAKEAVFSK